jgi:hypothetical protein
MASEHLASGYGLLTQRERSAFREKNVNDDINSRTLFAYEM